jgi:hypothetical protein
MDVGDLPPIPTRSFWQFSSLAIFSYFLGPRLSGPFEALNNIFRSRHSYTIDKVRVWRQHVYSLDRNFQRDIVCLKWRL